MKLGERVKEIRENKGIMQKFVAEKLGQDSSWISRRESGESEISAIELHMILKILGVTYDEFFLPYNLAKRENKENKTA